MVNKLPDILGQFLKPDELDMLTEHIRDNWWEYESDRQYDEHLILD